MTARAAPTRRAARASQGLADRLAALGGSMRVESEPGSGTTVIGELPCGS